jgi:hypothetical protein
MENELIPCGTIRGFDVELAPITGTYSASLKGRIMGTGRTAEEAVSVALWFKTGEDVFKMLHDEADKFIKENFHTVVRP